MAAGPSAAGPGAPGKPAAPAASPWDTFKTACASGDAGAVQAAFDALKPADLAHVKSEPEVLVQMLKKLGGPGVVKLKTFALELAAGFDPIIKAFPAAAMKEPIATWVSTWGKTAAEALAVLKDIAGVDHSVIVELLGKLDEPGQVAVASDATLRAFVQAQFPGKYPTDVFTKVKSWSAPFKAQPALATWLASDDTKLNALITTAPDKAQWIGALIPHADVLRRLMALAGWKQLFIAFSTTGQPDHAALKADAALLKDVLTLLGEQDSSTFLKNLDCDLLAGAKAMQSASPAALKAYFNDARFTAVEQAAACHDADIQNLLTSKFAASFISDIMTKLTVASAELPVLYKDVQPIAAWMMAGANLVKLQTALKAPTPNLAAWIEPLVANHQESFILLSAAANAAPWVAAVTGAKLDALLAGPPQAAG
ncbi:MAG TPA: hypothetical protein VIA18_06705, partial [Polyangia bacterium]|nr:hypothetical protein [Polyangia bacterium]